jgi:DNA-directed RNA polymerase specialized sigma24 family protein
VARSRRERLLRAHRHRLSREDLEDCYSQATLELLLRARRGPAFACERHIANALDQRLLSRIHDRRRALEGRSAIEAALASALPLGHRERGEVEPADVGADVEQLVHARQQLRLLREAAAHLSADQRLVLRSQLLGEHSPRELCRREGWSAEKYRKVAQRARARLRRFVECPVSRGASDERAGTPL